MKQRLHIAILTAAMLVAATVPAQAVFSKSSRTKVNDMCAGQLYVGGRLGLGLPNHMQRAAEEIGFNDVAQKGFVGLAECMWMQSNALGVGAELGFANFPYNTQFWRNMATRGTFEAKYHDVWLMLTGRLTLGSARIKPTAGVLAGCHFVSNSINFNSRWQGTSQDESVNYKSTQTIVGYGFEVGLLTKISKGAFASFAVRLCFAPGLKEEELVTVDNYTWQERRTKVNPHGNQNHIEIVVGVDIGLFDRFKK